MDPLIISILFVFGLIIGSFLNVVILRFNTGMSTAQGRSLCFSCGKTLAWKELIPLFSFIIQKGSCKSCGSRIAWQYPLVEIAGGFAWVGAYILYPQSLFLFICTALLFCIYIVIAAYDIRHSIIPDFFSYLAAVCALLSIGIERVLSVPVDPTRIIAGPVLFLFFYTLWKVSKGKWLGLGDGKLALSMGWVLGLSSGIAALMMSFWIASILSLGSMAFQRVMGRGNKLHLSSAVPFGPYLIIGFLISLFFHIDMQALISFLAV